MSLCAWSADERPREKFLRHGPAVLSDAELVAILLRTGGGRGRSVIDVARAVIAAVGKIGQWGDIDVDRLRQIDGIGEVKAVTIAAAVEIARRWTMPADVASHCCDSSTAIFAAYGPRLSRLPREELLVVALTARYHVLRDIVVAVGDLDAAVVQPRALFQLALGVHAATIVILHNHPSGDPTPSDADRACTARVASAGALIGIPLLDHLIIGEGCYFSFRDAGLLK